jgi:hypothetical protein
MNYEFENIGKNPSGYGGRFFCAQINVPKAVANFSAHR